VAWGRTRTPRVFVVDEDGTLRDPDDETPAGASGSDPEVAP
jgi:hypothetical protein